MVDSGEGRRRRAARLIAGGVLGAAVVLGRRRRVSEPGLRAFEDAPCFRELSGRPVPERRPAAAPEGDDGR